MLHNAVVLYRRTIYITFSNIVSRPITRAGCTSLPPIRQGVLLNHVVQLSLPVDCRDDVVLEEQDVPVAVEDRPGRERGRAPPGRPLSCRRSLASTTGSAPPSLRVGGSRKGFFDTASTRHPSREDAPHLLRDHPLLWVHGRTQHTGPGRRWRRRWRWSPGRCVPSARVSACRRCA